MIYSRSVYICLVQVALIVLLASPATAQWDPATAHIKPTSGPPAFDPAPWNGAYKASFRHVSFSKSMDGVPAWPFAPFQDANTQQDCSTDGFHTTPASTVDVGACFYKNNTDGTFDFWRKERTLAFSKANCYCYALNRFEGDTCQPGYSNNARGRKLYSDKMTCPALHLSITDDGAVPVSRSEALSGQPAQGHYIVLMARADGCTDEDCLEEDFHFLRKDASGTWSWKLPNMPASDKDFEGRPITNPDTAPLPGHYTVCGYYRVEPEKIFLGKVSPRPGPLSDMRAVTSYNNTSVEVSITPVLYNPRLDGQPPIRVRTLLAQQAAWERKRGTQTYKDWKQKQLVALELVAATTTGSPTDSLPRTTTGTSSPAPSSTDIANTGLLAALQNQLAVTANTAGGAKGSVPPAATRGRKLKSIALDRSFVLA